MEPKHAQTHAPAPGLIAGMLGIARNFLGLIANRIELASLELSEIGANLIKFLVLFTMAAIALWFALAFWTALLIFLAWDSWGWKILAVLGSVFTIVTIGLGWYACQVVRQGKLSLPMTMAELRKDRDALL
jgi:uncharacterized membrane protein YqjE